MSKQFASLLHGSRAPLAAVLVVALTGGAATAISADKVNFKDLSPKLKKLIKAKAGTGRDGAQGPQGQPGGTGSPGAPGSNAVFNASNWSAIPRNNIGSPRVELQDGPHGSFGVTGAAANPPFGTGSLGIGVSDNAMADPPGTSTDPQEKASFGNETDFFGDPVLDLSQVGFHVFQTGENANIGARNMPNIVFEIDPNLAATASNFSSMVWIPDAAPVTNQWSGYLDATTTGDWYLTGAAGTATGCNQSTTCEFGPLMTALNDGGDAPVIFSAAVGKGRDDAWFGAVDGFRINNTIYDFEPLGVVERAP